MASSRANITVSGVGLADVADELDRRERRRRMLQSPSETLSWSVR